MRLTIHHVTEFHYDEPVVRGMQRLRFTPKSTSGQLVERWDLTVDGGRTEAEYRDHYGNEVRLISIESGIQTIRVLAEGVVETADTSGITAPDPSVPIWVFLRSTELTRDGDGIAELIEPYRGRGIQGVDVFHELSTGVAQTIRYTPEVTTVHTTAEQALAQGSGVCQDHAHVLIAAARALGAPARYASGYLCHRTDQPDHDGAAEADSAMHAWAEVHVEDLGWVGFDPSNGISPDERYVRVAVGLDYDDVPPSSGLLQGGGEAHLDVSLQVAEQ